ncbi:MAG: aminopeptidase family protein [Devosia sp.]|uniref:M24 family metallopeptidase n=1 Tax=Devosia sp. TaxID=1871048 RepID=UPI0026287D9B|nr:Xaa-Pro peptidase family protein [Devosia sp.]MDB5539611.1 aminopeptidase family protein [Devosia sp.]
MARGDFAAEEFQRRLWLVREQMRARDLNALVVIHPASIHWLTGSEAKSYQEFQCLIVGVTDDAPLVVLARAGEVHEFETEARVDEVVGWGGGITEDPIAAFEVLARRLGLLGESVGLEVPSYYLHPYHYQRLRDFFGSEHLIDATMLVAELRMVKSLTELSYVREAARLADMGMDAFTADLAVGRRELELAGAVYGALLKAGSGIAASPINLVSGPRSAYSHGAPTERQISAGDCVNVEFGATFKRYTATIGRQFVMGQPTPRMRELYDIVRAASDAMIALIRDGVAAIEVHEAARRVIAAAGLEPYRVHLSGYGLGPSFPPSWAEPLHLIDGAKYILRAGMVITIEPPVFIGAEGLGVRIIDNAIVTDTGAELLAASSRKLIEIG